MMTPSLVLTEPAGSFSRQRRGPYVRNPVEHQPGLEGNSVTSSFVLANSSPFACHEERIESTFVCCVDARGAGPVESLLQLRERFVPSKLETRRWFNLTGKDNYDVQICWTRRSSERRVVYLLSRVRLWTHLEP